MEKKKVAAADIVAKCPRIVLHVDHFLKNSLNFDYIIMLFPQVPDEYTISCYSDFLDSSFFLST